MTQQTKMRKPPLEGQQSSRNNFYWKAGLCSQELKVKILTVACKALYYVCNPPFPALLSTDISTVVILCSLLFFKYASPGPASHFCFAYSLYLKYSLPRCLTSSSVPSPQIIVISSLRSLSLILCKIAISSIPTIICFIFPWHTVFLTHNVIELLIRFLVSIPPRTQVP